MTAAGHIRVVPANEASCADLDQIFGDRGAAHTCRCQRYKLPPGEAFKHVPVEERAERLCEQTACGNGDAAATTGLVAYLDDEPAGWCAVEPRADYEGLTRVFRVPWEGRDEDRSDPTVYAVTCLLTRKGFRKRGVSRALARAAVAFARERGARAIEAYPIVQGVSLLEELHVGTAATFGAAGFTEVSRPTLRRAVVRIDF